MQTLSPKQLILVELLWWLLTALLAGIYQGRPNPNPPGVPTPPGYRDYRVLDGYTGMGAAQNHY